MLLPHVQVGGPAAGADPPLAPEALEHGLVREQVAGGDRAGAVEVRPDLLDRLGGDVRDREVSGRASTSETTISTPFTFAFAAVASTASGSKSTATSGPWPSRAAAIESTPDPQPTSSREPGGSAASSSMQSCVVAWPPVPNAWPGSTTTVGRPAGGVSQGGPIQSPPTSTGWWKRRQRCSQSSSTSAASVATAPLNAAQIRSSPPAFEYAASSIPKSVSTSSNPSGKSSSISARACSARSRATVTETRRRMLS